MMRYICCSCHRILAYGPSVQSGQYNDSGTICPRCIFITEPEFYQEQKKQGFFTAEEVIEAESFSPPPLYRIIGRDLSLLGQAISSFGASLWRTLKSKVSFSKS